MRAISAERKGWSPLGPAQNDTRIQLHIALQQSNTGQLLSALTAVSDSQSPRYQDFLTHDQVNKLTRPSQEAFDAVSRWLATHPRRGGGLLRGEEATPNGDFLHVNVSVSDAEALLGSTSFWTWEHKATGHRVTRLAPGASYTLPPSVANFVDFVSPTVTFPPVPVPAGGPRAAVPAAGLRERKAPSANPDITLPRLRALANMTDADVGHGPNAKSGLKQGVASFLGHFYAPEDLSSFRKKYRLSTTSLDALLLPVPAAQKHSPVGVEASMDVQYITSTGDQVVTEHWSTPGVQPGNPENEPFVK
jgi:tripeptidyl-peptidase-1